MNSWFAKGAVLAGCAAMIAIRAPHGRRSRSVKVISSRKGPLEVALLTLAWLGFFIPLLWTLRGAFAFAEYPLHPVPYVAGVLGLALGLWLFRRSHADLGKNWSITLQVREGHTLVSEGIYRRIRHPMYLALLLYSFGQALVLPNWVAGPTYLVAMGLLFALRVGPEERMMLDEFGKDYEAYMARTKRLVPGVW
ncbi:MAG: isoprenylcysteine carboxylmethyltransferase family protein [Planctomycetes bacterium]|nr:isoprenylcysteine carboxylmethyltransferase family protein [Planctomycetota bacterium]